MGKTYVTQELLDEWMEKAMALQKEYAKGINGFVAFYCFGGITPDDSNIQAATGVTGNAYAVAQSVMGLLDNNPALKDAFVDLFLSGWEAEIEAEANDEKPKIQ